MTSKIIFLFLLFFNTVTVFAQDVDSLTLVNKLEQYEFTSKESPKRYFDLFYGGNIKFLPEQQYKYLSRAAKFAKQFKQDSLYIDISLTKIDRLNNEYMDVGDGKMFNVERSKLLAKEIEGEVKALNSNFFQGRYYNLRGIPYHIEENYVEALENYAKSIEFFKKSANPAYSEGVISCVVQLYGINEDHPQAIKYTRELLALNKHIKEPNDKLLNEVRGYFTLAQLFGKLEENDSVNYYIDKAIEIVPKINPIKDFYAVCDLYAYKINLLLLEEAFFEAEILQKRADVICKGPNRPKYTLFLADYYLKTNDYAKAGEILKDTISFSNNRYFQSTLLNLEARYHEGIGNYKKAVIAQKELLKINEKSQKAKRIKFKAYADARLAASKQAEEINVLKLKGEKETFKSQVFLGGLLTALLFMIMGIAAYRKLKQNKTTIQEQAIELKRVDTLKSKLFTNISHELRTPLTLISGAIEEIPNHVQLNETAQKQLALASNSSKQLLQLSNQIMDLTKSEIGDIKVNIARFHWGELLETIRPSILTMAKNKGLVFQETTSDTAKLLLQSDPTKLKVIVDNLLQNSVKYSKEGTIFLNAKDQGNSLTFSVKDTGIGITKTELPLVFNRYYQSQNSTEAEGGFGIGLAICQEYVQLLGGSIQIKSQEGIGTAVTVTIPKTIGASDAVPDYTFDTVTISQVPTLVTNLPNIKEEAAPHLLIVEDNENLSQFLQTVLGDDYNLSFAANGIEALEKLEKITPSLILTDWMMPIMNGLEFLQKLKEDAALNNIPVLMLTARSLPIDQLKAFQKGVDDYLLKPFETSNLKLRIEHLLDVANERKEVDDSIAPDKQVSALKNNTPEDLQWISSLEEIIQGQISDFDLSSAKIALETHFSTVHLNRKIKAITGLTTMKFVDEIRFWEARRLLEEKEEFSVKAVAYSIGFKSVKNFSRNFNKRFGKYPSAYLD